MAPPTPLPTTSRPAHRTGPDHGSRRATGGVLIAEDDPVTAEIFAARLFEEGFTVRLARDGLQACRAIDAHGPEVVVLDMALPVLPGIEVLRHLRRRRHAPTVVVVSGSGPEDFTSDDATLGTHRWLRKPCRPGELARTIHDLL